MWVAIILACGTLGNGAVTMDCRSFAPKSNVASEQQCLQQVAVGAQLMMEHNWTMIDYHCFNWADKPDEKTKGEPT